MFVRGLEPILDYMRHKKPLGDVLLTTIFLMVCSSSASAQLPDKIKNCLPYPTLEDELKTMAAESRGAGVVGPGAPSPKIVIKTVEFQSTASLPHSALQRLIQLLEQGEFDANSPWLDEVASVPVRGAWMDQGYLHAEVSATSRSLAGDSSRRLVSVTFHVNAGRQYRLGDIQFVGAKAFGPKELREQVPLRKGQLFAVNKIRKGFESLTNLYGSLGYLDFNVNPEFNTDDVEGHISLLLQLDEGKQFHVGHLSIENASPEIERILRAEIKAGDVFNDQLLKIFFEKNETALPPNAPHEDVSIHHDVRTGIVDLDFDFWSCPVPMAQ